MPKRRALFVIGMHRSGTSALARVLNLQGATLPRTLMPAQADNPDGFWESLPVVQFNERLLQEACLTWDDPRPVNASWWAKKSENSRHVDEAKRLLRSEFSGSELFVLKDPRISRLMHVWLDACREMDIAPSVFLCLRNPLEVAASLEMRNGMDVQRAQLLWLAYVLDAEATTRSVPRALLHFDDFLIDWRAVMPKAYDAIGLDCLTLSGDAADAVDNFLSMRKGHHRATTDQLLRNQGISSLLKETWVAFSKVLVSHRET